MPIMPFTVEKRQQQFSTDNQPPIAADLQQPAGIVNPINASGINTHAAKNPAPTAGAKPAAPTAGAKPAAPHIMKKPIVNQSAAAQYAKISKAKAQPQEVISISNK